MPQKQFDKPLDKWVEEEEDVERVNNIFNPETRKITQETVIEKQKFKVRYDRVVGDFKTCTPFEHEWFVSDSHKYIISCRKCPLNKHIMPGREYIDPDGHVRSRDNDLLIA